MTRLVLLTLLVTLLAVPVSPWRQLVIQHPETDTFKNPLPFELKRTASDWKSRSIYQVLTDRFQPPQPCHDLQKYCGGTFKSVMDSLDYITAMGFNAIWISPVPENTENGYHGYWAKNLTNINPYFGTADELKQLVKACHERDVWVMLDVVANHMGTTKNNEIPVFPPFDKPEHYHSYCLIKNYENQGEVEYCRIGDDSSSLADLNTEHPEVIQGLNRWIKWVVREFDFDAIRIDTVKHVRRDFWNEFSRASGVFSIGEVLHGDPAYVGPYQHHMDSLLNFPLYFVIRDVFTNKKSMRELEWRIAENRRVFKDASVLGNFIDNHDFPRFLNGQKDLSQLQNALTLVFLLEGIPIMYYGTELYFSGGDDPQNREPFYPKSIKEAPLQNFITTLNRVRNDVKGSYREIWIEDDVFVFMRGDETIVCLTNVGDNVALQRWIKVPSRQDWVNVFDNNEKLRYGQRDGGSWWVEVQLEGGRPKVFIPTNRVQANTTIGNA